MLDRVHKGSIVTCVVTAVQSNGIEVKVDEVLTGFIRRAELARDKGEQRPDRFAIGEKVDAKVMSVDRAARKLQLTIKGKEQDEDKQAIQESAARNPAPRWATFWGPRSVAATSRPSRSDGNAPPSRKGSSCRSKLTC